MRLAEAKAHAVAQTLKPVAGKQASSAGSFLAPRRRRSPGQLLPFEHVAR